MNELSKVRRALISVSDKQGVAEFAKRLASLGIEILSTGGTAKLLSESDVRVTEISTYTGFPELLEGRLKTLHPKVHGGLLGRRGIDDAIMGSHDIPPIDLVVVNLYPFEQTVADPQRDLADAIENIDIGGPTMLRAAAKNYDAVAVLVDKADYADIAHQLETQDGCTTRECRFRLAVKAFEHTARYDGAIANYLGRLRPGGQPAPFANTVNMQLHLAQEMRYGENPHQKAAFYKENLPPEDSVAGARQIQGKALSYNNVADADAALECVKQFAEPACVIVKHANPCGVATAETLEAAYDAAFRTDPTSAFGGVIAFNRPLDAATACNIIERQFVEVLIAPGVSDDTVKSLATRENVRLLTCAPWPDRPAPALDFKRVGGGLLVQSRDIDLIGATEPRVVTQRAPTAMELDDLQFAWRVAKFVKSNAIVYARDHGTVGIGAGQMSRVYSAKIAALKATDEGIPVTGSVMASDAFFPFRDGIDTAAAEGITAVIQPGGSVRDAEVIDAANGHGMAMVFTSMRHFRH